MAKFKIYPFTNDYVFKKTLATNKHITQQIIKIITGNDVTIEQLEQEQVINPTILAPSVRYDVFLLTNENSIYDIEMQNYRLSNLLLRTRYYVSCNDVDFENNYSNKDEFTYDKLPESYIIFICTYDPFNENQVMYIAKETLYANIFDKNYIINDYQSSEFSNKVTKIFINASKKSPISYNEFVNKDLVNLIQYIKTNIPCDKLTNEINNCVKQINRHDRGMLMNWQDHINEVNQYFKNEGLQEGIIEGQKEGLIALVTSLKSILNDINKIYDVVVSNDVYKDVTLDEVTKIYTS